MDRMNRRAALKLHTFLPCTAAFPAVSDGTSMATCGLLGH